MTKRALTMATGLVLLAATALAADPSTRGSLPVGTAVKMKLETPLSTTTSKAGDNFAGRVTEAVALQGKTVIPVGASVKGHVIAVSEPRRVQGVPMIHLVPDEVTMPSGERYEIRAVVVDTVGAGGTDVDDEGRIKGSGATKGEKIEMAAGTGGGVLVGGLAGGGKGALIGGAIGATATVAHWLTKRHSTDLPAGTEIIMELSRPMTMRTLEE